MYGGGGKGMGGGGGRVLKVLGKSVARAGVTNLQETISSSSSATGSATSPTALSRSKHRLNSSNILSLSSASGTSLSSCNAPVSANNGGPNTTPWPYFPSVTCDSSSDEFEWVSVDGSEEERTVGVSDDNFLGPVPSLDEVHGAVSALTQIFDASAYSQFISDRFAYNEDKDVADQISSPLGILRRASPAGSDLDWVEPSPHLCNSRMLHPYGPDRVYDTFHLLQSEPAIQRMVISLSSDKAVWNAVLNNNVVRELRDSYNAESVTSPSSESSDEASEESTPAMNVVKWIFQNTMAKFMDLIENITKLMNELFKAPDDKKKANGTADPFEDKLRTSFLLSVVVLLIVVVNRAHMA
ncbi:uncharacterized protein [Euphorbia lathyris]|uniref:uncharacterized protein n=1 Tax=Euphorbia lathyris TaxID=212925 RepID=UPI00331321E1